MSGDHLAESDRAVTRCPICGGTPAGAVRAAAAVVEVHAPPQSRKRLVAVLDGLARRLHNQQQPKENPDE